MGGRKRQTVGYNYYLGWHMVLCHGPIDHISAIYSDEKQAWIGNWESGSIFINQPGLYGGEDKEGGIAGQFDLEQGGPAQGQNAYLVSKLGSDIPAYRQVCAIVARQIYVGTTTYLKKFAALASRIHVRQDGSEQWYDEKAAIGEVEIPVPISNPVPWNDLSSNFFNIGTGKATFGPYVSSNTYFKGYIDSVRVTKGMSISGKTTWTKSSTPSNLSVVVPGHLDWSVERTAPLWNVTLLAVTASFISVSPGSPLKFN